MSAEGLVKVVTIFLVSFVTEVVVVIVVVFTVVVLVSAGASLLGFCIVFFIVSKIVKNCFNNWIGLISVLSVFEAEWVPLVVFFVALYITSFPPSIALPVVLLVV